MATLTRTQQTGESVDSYFTDARMDVNQCTDHGVTWDNVLAREDWLKDKPVEKWKEFFAENGYLVVEDLLGQRDIKSYRDIYQKMITGEIDTSSHRHDLGNHVKKTTESENVCQIMWPQLFVQNLDKGPLHARSQAIARLILGEDMDFDFDMLIYKAPYTMTETPWHQDESYWPDLNDKRAVSCWVAMDEATVDNGCMWFVPGSFKEGVRKHHPVAEGVHVLKCELSPEDTDITPVPLRPGSCTFHHGRTLHRTEGNSTGTQRRAYITNFRPKSMVEQERSLGYDHGKKGLDIILAKGKTHESQDQ